MRPILLKGHERSVTSVKYNKEGDLLFSVSKHPSFAVWYTSTGERIGTYEGHNGAVWSIDVDRHSERVITGSADNSAKMWDAETGRELVSWPHKSPVRAVDFALGDKQFLTVTDQVLGHHPTVNIWDVSRNPREKPVLEFLGKNEAKILCSQWGTLNQTIITGNEDGTIRVYDVRNGAQLKIIEDHVKAVMGISFNQNGTLFISASKDGTARLFDAETWQLLKTYYTGRPINSASISPIKEEVIVGGGQSAESVTTTRVDNTQFRVRFYHMIFEEELGSLQGHFGPVNVLAYSPDGTGFASGGEDGYVRLHHFDRSYFRSDPMSGSVNGSADKS
jgi:translation initiation factor 3 subunit I